MENYEQKYKEALERARVIINEIINEQTTIANVIASLENVIPGLKESEDERIRKGLINYFNDFTLPTFGGLDPKKILAWLEKQGEQEQDPCEHCKDKCLNCHNFPCIDKRAFEQGKSALEAIKEEKVDNANKIEPKFKVGDWIVRGKTIAQILDIQEQYYVGLDVDGNDFTSSRFLSDDKIHLWTIQDAKDGDVLYNKDDFAGNSVFIYKGISDKTHARLYYARFFKNKNFSIYNDVMLKNGVGVNGGEFYPATKEQRDIFFVKMKEAGYEWDADKKELKKIEKKLAWSEEDERIYKVVLELIDSYSKGTIGSCIIPPNVERYAKWLKSIKNRYTWKPSDEQMEEFRYYLDDINWEGEILVSLYNDLKKLIE